MLECRSGATTGALPKRSAADGRFLVPAAPAARGAPRRRRPRLCTSSRKLRSSIFSSTGTAGLPPSVALLVAETSPTHCTIARRFLDAVSHLSPALRLAVATVSSMVASRARPALSSSGARFSRGCTSARATAPLQPPGAVIARSWALRYARARATLRVIRRCKSLRQHGYGYPRHAPQQRPRPPPESGKSLRTRLRRGGQRCCTRFGGDLFFAFFRVTPPGGTQAQAHCSVLSPRSMSTWRTRMSFAGRVLGETGTSAARSTQPHRGRLRPQTCRIWGPYYLSRPPRR